MTALKQYAIFGASGFGREVLPVARQQLAADEETVEAESRRLELAQMRYEGGVASYSDVLDAQRYLFSAQLTAVQTRNNLLNATVQLYKALGGGWRNAAGTPAAGIADAAGKNGDAQ